MAPQASRVLARIRPDVVGPSGWAAVQTPSSTSVYGRQALGEAEGTRRGWGSLPGRDPWRPSPTQGWRSWMRTVHRPHKASDFGREAVPIAPAQKMASSGTSMPSWGPSPHSQAPPTVCRSAQGRGRPPQEKLAASSPAPGSPGVGPVSQGPLDSLRLPQGLCGSVPLLDFRLGPAPAGAIAVFVHHAGDELRREGDDHPIGDDRQYTNDLQHLQPGP